MCLPAQLRWLWQWQEPSPNGADQFLLPVGFVGCRRSNAALPSALRKARLLHEPESDWSERSKAREVREACDASKEREASDASEASGACDVRKTNEASDVSEAR